MERTNLSVSEDLALQIFSSDSYLVVNKNLLQELGPNLAIYICNIVDKYRYFKEVGQVQDDGSFVLSYEDQIVQTGMSKYDLRAAKIYFKEHGIIETYRQGMPAKEYFVVHINTLVKSLKCLTASRKQFKRHDIRTTNDNTSLYIGNHNISLDDKKSPRVLPKKNNKNLEYLPLAKYLSKSIQCNKNIGHTTKQINSWTNDIRRLVDDHNISFERIAEALRWYRKNIGGQYIPVIESGKSLREKFAKLEAAMQRDQQGSFSKQEPKTKIVGGQRYSLHKDGRYYNSDNQLLND